LREGSSWAENKAQLLERYFPFFVHERLIRELIVFHFHGEGQSLRQYIEGIFRVAKFLDYQAKEEQLVEKVIIFSTLVFWLMLPLWIGRGPSKIYIGW
jgi:hypothetical protein